MPTEINRTNISLPGEVSNEIWQQTQESSAVMKLARPIRLPGLGVTIPVITGDPEAAWVAETEKKPVSRGSMTTKLMSAYTLAVIVPFSNQFRRDARALYDALVQRLPGALASKFDATVFGDATAPGSNFDTLAACGEKNISTDPYKALVDADEAIATAGGILNGYALAPQGKAILLRAVDNNKRPLFINSMAEGTFPRLLSAPVTLAKGVYVEATNTVGVAGDWTRAVYGTVEGVKVAISDQATLDDGGATINLFQQNMFAVRAEIEVGFRCDPSVFVRLTRANA